MRLTKPGKLIISAMLITAFASAFTLNPYAANSKEGEKFTYAVEPSYDFLGYLIEGMAVTTEGAKVGYVGTDGKVLKPQWDQAHQFKNGVAVVELNGQCGLIDKTGKYIVPLGKYKYFEDTYPFTNGFIKVSINPSLDTGNVWGLVDITTGKEILKPEYHKIEPFSHGFALVGKRGDLGGGNEKDKYGFIDKTGNFVIPLKFQSAESFSEGVAAARMEQNGKYGYIDRSGKYVIKPKWDRAEAFKDGYAQISQGIIRGLINKSGFEVVKPRCFPFPTYWPYEGKIMMLDENKLYIFENNGKYSAVDFPIVFEMDGFPLASKGYFSDGLAKFEYNGKVGYLNKKAEFALPLKWDFGTDFYNGVATVQLHGKNGQLTETCLINTKGDVLYSENFDVAFEFIDDLIRYLKDGRYYIIDMSGKLLIAGEWDTMKDFSEGYAPVKKDGKWGYIDKTGKVVIEPQWEDAEPVSNGHAIVLRDGKYGIIKLIEGK